jgi:hypothetical protein
VDRTAAEVTVDSVPTTTLGGPPVSLSRLNLSGRLADQNGIRSVEICQGPRCDNTALQPSSREWSYSDGLAAPMAIGSCSSTRLERTFAIPESYSVGEVRLGLQVEIGLRDRLVLELTSPSGMTWQLLGDDFDRSTDFGNLSVILSDRAAAGLSALRASQVLTAGGFAAFVRPHLPLAIFNGQVAAGNWKLSLCQDNSDGEQATYRGAQLWVEPPNTQPVAGSWHTSLNFGALDDVDQTVFVYGTDAAGNRSLVPQALTFRIDNVTPVLNITQFTPQLTILPNLAPQTVLTGNVSDGGKVVRVLAYVRDPDGIGSSVRPLVNEDLTWQVQLQPMKVGTYQLWLAAEDEAGNLTPVGPFIIEVAGIPESPLHLLAPEAPPTPTVPITTTLPVTPTTTLPLPGPTETPVPVVPPGDTVPTPTPPTTSTVGLAPGALSNTTWATGLVPGHDMSWRWFPVER